MLKITFLNGQVLTYDEKPMELKYDGKRLLIFKGENLVRLYNMDAVLAVEVTDEPEAEEVPETD